MNTLTSEEKTRLETQLVGQLQAMSDWKLVSIRRTFPFNQGIPLEALLKEIARRDGCHPFTKIREKIDKLSKASSSSEFLSIYMEHPTLDALVSEVKT